MHCISCGKELEPGSLFCVHCGMDVEGPGEPLRPGRPQAPAAPRLEPTVILSDTAPAATPAPAPFPAPAPYPAPAAPEIPPKKKKPFPVLAAVLCILAVLAVGGLFAARGILTHLHSPERAIDQFVESVRDGDVDKFRKVTVLGPDSGLELNEDTLAPFFRLYDGDAVGLTRLQTTLRKSLNTPEDKPAAGGVRLIRESHLLYSAYKVQLTPTYIRISGGTDGTVVELAGETYTLNSGAPLEVELMPGAYDVTARFVAPNTGVEFTWTDTCSLKLNKDTELTVRFDTTETTVGCYVDDVTLKEIYVDGRVYAGDLSQVDLSKGFVISPVKPDSQIRVVAEAYGTEFEETFTPKDGPLYLRPQLSASAPVSTPALDAAKDIARQFAIPYLRVRVSRDADSLKQLTDGPISIDDDFLDETTQWLEEEIRSIEGRSTPFQYFEYTNLSAGDVEVLEGSNDTDASFKVWLQGEQIHCTGWGADCHRDPPNGTHISVEVSMRCEDNVWVVYNASAR